MLIVDLTYKKSLEEVGKCLEAHRKFLDQYYSAGIFIASGAKNPRDGGIILAITDRATLEALLKEDPFYQNQIAEYKITEFIPSKYCESLKHLVG